MEDVSLNVAGTRSCGQHKLTIHRVQRCSGALDTRRRRHQTLREELLCDAVGTKMAGTCAGPRR